MKLFNSLSRTVEEVTPRESGKIGMYTCGPTVYSTPTIGNFRTYTLSDILARSLEYLGYDVTHVMNLTDVGHLTGDNEGDSSQGEDRLEKAAKKEGKTAWEISEAYAKEFFDHMQRLGIKRPSVVCLATEHIPEQIKMVEALQARGLVYTISDGLYFDVAAYDAAGNKYGELSTLDQIKFGARLEPNKEKKDPRDFALWKFSPNPSAGSGQASGKRDMEWESPWGTGFPGWHIECSAMSTKYLGDQFDIHVGGEDLRSTHHPNEIAQAEGATGKKPFVTTWVHGAFLLVDGGRMGKSLGNAYTVSDIESRGYDPLSLRYFYMTGHYRRQLNFTWESLKGASVALGKLRGYYQSFAGDQANRTELSSEKAAQIEEYQNSFKAALENDLDLPRAIATLWDMVKSNIPNYDKLDLMREWDKVLGLNLGYANFELNTETPEQIKELISQRDEARVKKDYAQADKIRMDIEKLGYKLEDKGGKTRATKI
ncbi:cysteine--tRNA ligase [Candidatus Woesebacteria bacterium]|nr:cysteine--tRNA ligase [Candidatus Woesebacteria bacterium]